MLKVGIIGANGTAGALIAANAVTRNMDVTAIVRHPDDSDKTYHVLTKDLFDLTTEDIQNFDVLVNAAAFRSEPDKFLSSTQHLIGIVKPTQVRLMLIGGAGSLFMDKTRTTRYENTKDYPANLKPMSDAKVQSLELLEKTDGITWTVVSPAVDFTPMGGLTNQYQLNDDILTTDDDGKSFLSYKDFAQAFVTIMTDKKYYNKHVSIHHV